MPREEMVRIPVDFFLERLTENRKHSGRHDVTSTFVDRSCTGL